MYNIYITYMSDSFFIQNIYTCRFSFRVHLVKAPRKIPNISIHIKIVSYLIRNLVTVQLSNKYAKSSIRILKKRGILLEHAINTTQSIFKNI